MSVKSLYNDVVTLTEDVTQIATREGSIEINAYTTTVYGYRVNIDGCWSIISSTKYDKDALEKLKRKVFSISLTHCGGFAEAELYKGRVEIGKNLVDADEIIKLIYDLCSESRGYDVIKCEIIVTIRDMIRSIERDVNDVAYERKHIVEVEIGLVGRSSYGSASFASNYMTLIPWTPKDVAKHVENLFKSTVDKISNMYKLKPLKPYLYGRAVTILDNIASAALFHELSHLFDPTYGQSMKITGHRICPDEIEIYDEPHNVEASSLRFFDDEGVISKKRTIIEDGVVRDLHHTRTTAKIMESEPGSAHGLFHKPAPFHTTLVIKPGDWRYSEILEDTRKGFYVGGVVLATLEDGFIRIVPEYGYIVEDGELREIVKIKEVKVPIIGIKTINAVSRDTKVRTSYEKTWLVSEIAPAIRLEAYIQ